MFIHLKHSSGRNLDIVYQTLVDFPTLGKRTEHKNNFPRDKNSIKCKTKSKKTQQAISTFRRTTKGKIKKS